MRRSKSRAAVELYGKHRQIGGITCTSSCQDLVPFFTMTGVIDLPAALGLFEGVGVQRHSLRPRRAGGSAASVGFGRASASATPPISALRRRRRNFRRATRKRSLVRTQWCPERACAVSAAANEWFHARFHASADFTSVPRASGPPLTTSANWRRPPRRSSGRGQDC